MALAAPPFTIRAVAPRELDADFFDRIARLYADAYPITRLTNDAALQAYAARLRDGAADAETQFAVAERNGELIGAMRLYDYAMNVRGRDAFTGGLGGVAVGLAFKRRGVARALVTWYLEDYRRRGAPFAILHPFRPDFYRALGFGYGTPLQQFRLAAPTIRCDGADGTARLLREADADALIACYERVRATTNGLIARYRGATQRELRDPASRFVGVERAGVLRGFMQTHVVPPADTMLRNRDELVVRDVIAEDDAALAALLAYLRSQSDQFPRITIDTYDPAFYLTSTDPRDGSDLAIESPAVHRVGSTGLGVMYRILDVEAAFAYLPAAPASFTLEVAVTDALLPPNAAARTFRFGPHGAPVREAAGPADARLAIGIADLSSVVAGSLSLRALVRHRLAALEPRARLHDVAAAFEAEQPPQCTTRF